MRIASAEVDLFYKLYAALCSYANSKLKCVLFDFSAPEQYTALPPELRLKVREALYAQPELIDQFVHENPAHFSAEELAIVAGWKDALVGSFYVFRYLQPYAVFLTDKSPPKAYGVLALADPLPNVLGPDLPLLVKGVLLPFNGRIIYDGLLSTYRISFGPGIRRSLNEGYRQAKATFGIITSLPEGAAPPPAVRQKAPRPQPASAGPADVKAVPAAIVGLTDAFCREHLNEEYAAMCRQLAAALARKRPSPLVRGQRETWACGIVRTIGWVNFLGDRTQRPHMKLTQIDEAFGVSQSTGEAKAKTIRTLLKISQLDPRWTLPSKLDDNLRVWLLSVNGFVIDIRDAPRELQVAAYEKGLIPYIPADRPGAADDEA